MSGKGMSESRLNALSGIVRFDHRYPVVKMPNPKPPKPSGDLKATIAWLELSRNIFHILRFQLWLSKV